MCVCVCVFVRVHVTMGRHGGLVQARGAEPLTGETDVASELLGRLNLATDGFRSGRFGFVFAEQANVQVRGQEGGSWICSCIVSGFWWCALRSRVSSGHKCRTGMRLPIFN
jgi:hypothetical protein